MKVIEHGDSHNDTTKESLTSHTFSDLSCLQSSPRQRSSSSAESAATAAEKSSSPTPKRTGTLKRMMDKLGSPGRRRKAQSESYSPSGSSAEDGGSATKGDDDGSDKPHKGRLCKFVGSMRSKPSRNRDAKMERRHMTTSALAVSKLRTI